MKLGTWLKQKNMTHETFAALIGCDRSSVTRYVEDDGKKQIRMPPRKTLERIAQATNGEVTANDFVNSVVTDPLPAQIPHEVTP
jgi:transcriptional regulator with XRE-family HTH domain